MVAPHAPLTFFGDKLQLLSAAPEPSADEPLRRLAWHVLMLPGRHSDLISIRPHARYSSLLFEAVSELHGIESEILRAKNTSRSTLTNGLDSLGRVFRHDRVKAVIRELAAKLGLAPSEAWDARLSDEVYSELLPVLEHRWVLLGVLCATSAPAIRQTSRLTQIPTAARPYLDEWVGHLSSRVAENEAHVFDLLMYLHMASQCKALSTTTLISGLDVAGYQLGVLAKQVSRNNWRPYERSRIISLLDNLIGPETVTMSLLQGYGELLMVEANHARFTNAKARQAVAVLRVDPSNPRAQALVHELMPRPEQLKEHRSSLHANSVKDDELHRLIQVFSHLFSEAHQAERLRFASAEAAMKLSNLGLSLPVPEAMKVLGVLQWSINAAKQAGLSGQPLVTRVYASAVAQRPDLALLDWTRLGPALATANASEELMSLLSRVASFKAPPSTSPENYVDLMTELIKLPNFRGLVTQAKAETSIWLWTARDWPLKLATALMLVWLPLMFFASIVQQEEKARRDEQYLAIIAALNDHDASQVLSLGETFLASPSSLDSDERRSQIAQWCAEARLALAVDAAREGDLTTAAQLLLADLPDPGL